MLTKNIVHCVRGPPTGLKQVSTLAQGDTTIAGVDMCALHVGHHRIPRVTLHLLTADYYLNLL